jgi:C-methyltransferase
MSTRGTALVPSLSKLPHEIVWELTTAVVPSRCLQVVAELGVADQIGDEPASVKELAAACAADMGALDRALRLLSAHGIFEPQGDAYGHTEASRLLRTDHPMSMRAFPRMIGTAGFVATFSHLQHSIRTGSPAIELVESEGLWAYLAGHAAEAEIFGQAMTAKAGADIAAILGSYDFSLFGTIADIGGGRGHLLRAALDAVPAAQGILFELPPVIDALDIDRERLIAQAGDFFVDPLPSADAYILMEVIHDWGDAEAGAILRSIRRAAPEGSTVLIIEGVIIEGQADPRVHALDVIMLAITGGRERTVEQLGNLLSNSGFRMTNVIQTPGPMSIVEAVAV